MDIVTEEFCQQFANMVLRYLSILSSMVRGGYGVNSLGGEGYHYISQVGEIFCQEMQESLKISTYSISIITITFVNPQILSIKTLKIYFINPLLIIKIIDNIKGVQKTQ